MKAYSSISFNECMGLLIVVEKMAVAGLELLSVRHLLLES
jgi:hypothetical protein